ncbi:hypothetical protein TWF718_003409 [Orbilia javanica]|uniref:F-box domain-containing protein n=1 Tax=Orbilia javanica TaxID=47235 RepID=A0AAN8RBD8_9PEZI
MSILGGLALPPIPADIMRAFHGPRSLTGIYNDPSWPEALCQVFKHVCPAKSLDQSSKDQDFIDLWRTCRSVCKTWRNIIENPLFANPHVNATPDKQKLLDATFKGSNFARVHEEVQYCALATNWVQQKVLYEVHQQKLTPPDPKRRFGLRCHTEFRLLWRTSTVLQMYASAPVVKNVRIRSFIREAETIQRNALLRDKGFKIPGASVLREWDGWHLNAPGGVMIDMVVGFVALAVEIDVLMQNAGSKELIGTPRPRHLDLEFLHIDAQTCKCLGKVRFEIPMVEGQKLSTGNEVSDVWADLLNTVSGGQGRSSG